MAMKDSSKAILNYLKETNGENQTLADVATALGLPARSVNGSIVGLQRKKLAIREEASVVDADGKTTAVKYIRLTEEGLVFDPETEPAPKAKAVKTDA